MTPILQTEFGPQGNCFRACVASILDVPLEEVPDLRGDRMWGPKLREWLAGRGWCCEFREETPAGWSIASVRLMDGSIHAVVCQDGDVVHDPNPRAFGLQRSKTLMWTAMEPEKCHA